MGKDAQNLAFDVVHRNKPFEEALLEAVEMQSEKDFVTTLNSLSQENIYDVNHIDSYIADAKAQLDANQGGNPTVSDLQAIIQKFTTQLGKVEAKIEKSKQALKALETKSPAAKEESRKVGMPIIMGLLVGVGAVLTLFVIQLIIPAIMLLFVLVIASAAIFSGEKSNVREKEAEKNAKLKSQLKKQIRDGRKKTDSLKQHIHEQEELMSRLGGSAEEEETGEEE